MRFLQFLTQEKTLADSGGRIRDPHILLPAHDHLECGKAHSWLSALPLDEKLMVHSFLKDKLQQSARRLVKYGGAQPFLAGKD
ncbi:uncharacterized protein ACLA_003340 [Aspergillus clavatus NRRL 1]|uniref:Uncharacterized protein n=1 Tax=Aspergillus clavatus (strain ATCC 1007 / CBS 513.65 / DSM 816 / NCTC 3887 / NRRL 1 / QM 1276 / 107) TaxID=344612 RepID=A1C5F3_ASPCL|nr:uncharacterized protein ACLA_003340 [Aspergillus clavatus NRRL 1]EAW14921.1 hypothetical protein ACLA_003340 [Aspergillus clavatus NRRL 1]